MKTIISIILSAVMVMSLAGCGNSGGSNAGESKPTNETSQTTQTEKKVKSTLQVVLSSETTGLNPQACSMLNGYIGEFLIYDTLLQMDKDGNIVANLATEWEKIDDTHIRLKLRDDVYFSNGEKMTSADVVYTMQRCATMPTTQGTYRFIDSENTVAEDEYTVVLALKQPFAAVYNFLTHAYSSIVCKSYIEAVGEDEAGLAPVGTGAYVLDKWVSGATITLKRNENYWGEKGASEYINFKIIPEIASRAIELETGAADIALDLATTDAKRVADNEKLNLVYGPSYKTAFLGLNQAKEEMLNPKIREAISYALDTETIANVVYEQYGTPADSIMSSTINGYVSVGKHEYNVEKAKQILSEAGYPNGITLSGRCQTNVDFKTAAEVMQNMLAEAGIKAEIQVLDKATYSEVGKKDGGTHLTITSQTATTGDAYQAIGTMFSVASTSGIIGSKDTVLEDMINTASATYDDTERNKLYKEVQEYIVNNHYAIPIAFTSIVTGTTKNVENFVISPANTPDFTYVYAYEN